MLQQVCDRCGKVFKADADYYIEIKKRFIGDGTASGEFDLCRDCIGAVADYLNTQRSLREADKPFKKMLVAERAIEGEEGGLDND